MGYSAADLCELIISVIVKSLVNYKGFFFRVALVDLLCAELKMDLPCMFDQIKRNKDTLFAFKILR